MLRELPRTSPGTRGGRSVRILCDAGGLGAGKRGRGIPKAKETAACIVLPGRPAGPADRADRTEASAAMSACTRAAALAGALPIDSWRLERALWQPISLLDRPRPARHKFEVMGTRGIAYVVMLAADDDAGTSAETGASGYHVHPTSRAWDEDFPSCTCPDFKERRILCEHILFVLVKILDLWPPITRDMLDEAMRGPAAPRQHAAGGNGQGGGGSGQGFQTPQKAKGLPTLPTAPTALTRRRSAPRAPVLTDGASRERAGRVNTRIHFGDSSCTPSAGRGQGRSIVIDESPSGTKMHWHTSSHQAGGGGTARERANGKRAASPGGEEQPRARSRSGGSSSTTQSVSADESQAAAGLRGAASPPPTTAAAGPPAATDVAKPATSKPKRVLPSWMTGAARGASKPTAGDEAAAKAAKMVGKKPTQVTDLVDDSEGMGLLDDLCADDGEVPGPVAAADEPTARSSGRQRECSSPQRESKPQSGQKGKEECVDNVKRSASIYSSASPSIPDTPEAAAAPATASESEGKAGSSSVRAPAHRLDSDDESDSDDEDPAAKWRRRMEERRNKSASQPNSQASPSGSLTSARHAASAVRADGNGSDDDVAIVQIAKGLPGEWRDKYASKGAACTAASPSPSEGTRSTRCEASRRHSRSRSPPARTLSPSSKPVVSLADRMKAIRGY